jgi:hypothetical protein
MDSMNKSCSIVLFRMKTFLARKVEYLGPRTHKRHFQVASRWYTAQQVSISKHIVLLAFVFMIDE